LLAQRLNLAGTGSDPERWPLATQLFAALQLHDAPGALMMGEPALSASATHKPLPTADMAALAAELDTRSADVAATLPAGSSAGGEQPKFLAMLDTGAHVLVKFSPPLNTPFGQRWHDLLHTEAVALQTLVAHGVAAARCTVVSSALRSYLISERFDRVGPSGRRHVVSIGAAHAAFVPGPYQHWAASCEALARQRRLQEPQAAAHTARLLWQFGRLIGNADMHSGNLSLVVDASQPLLKGRFSLAPAYDMLSMRWRPDPMLGGAADYSPFEPDALSLAGPAASIAKDFWEALAERAEVSHGLREVATEMALRVSLHHSPRTLPTSF
jgi:HipA-like C-terminal domain